MAIEIKLAYPDYTTEQAAQLPITRDGKGQGHKMPSVKVDQTFGNVRVQGSVNLWCNTTDELNAKSKFKSANPKKDFPLALYLAGMIDDNGRVVQAAAAPSTDAQAKAS